jgi:hypothetical protein
MATSTTEQDRDLILEQDFVKFNKIRTVLCRNAPCLRGNKCTYAHSQTELRRSICMYHFNHGCNKSAHVCAHSHDDKDLQQSIIDYKKWKNPPKKQTTITPDELANELGDFKISLDEESDDESDDKKSESSVETTSTGSGDEIDREMSKQIKKICKRPYETVPVSDTSFTPSEEYLKKTGTEPLVPLEEWEKASQLLAQMNPYDNPISCIYQVVYNQQIVIMNLMNEVNKLKNEVKELSEKK